MNALLKAKSAYASAKAPTRTPRDMEFEVIARITQRMIKSSQNANKDFAALASALNENRKLWRVFSIDVRDPNNQLPEDLKDQITYLSAFTSTHTSKVLARKAGIGPLVEINTAIMRGLRSGAP